MSISWSNSTIRGGYAISSLGFNLLLALVLATLYNQPLWNFLLKQNESGVETAFLIAFMLLLAALFNLLLSLVGIKGIQRPLAIFLVISAAFAGYFMDTYGTLFDRTMIQNIAETDLKEASGLLSSGLVWHLLLYGLLPSMLIFKARIQYRSLGKEGVLRLAVVVVSALLMALVIQVFYKDFSSTLRNNRQIRNMILPTSYLYYGVRYAAEQLDSQERVVEVIGTDAVRDPVVWGQPGKKVVTLVVLGETARAMNFQINGYERETTPELSKRPILNFRQMSACGTSTAVSVPCLFSDLERSGFDVNDAHYRENVLDVLAHAGFRVLWRDNNSGCKGVCSRIENESSTAFWSDRYCNEAGCYDEAMLEGLDALLDQDERDVVLVLHQLGSHGPEYWKRYPDNAEVFAPTCKDAELTRCSRESIINAYDNSLHYTDRFLGGVIDFLEARRDHYASSMIYLSDHGESLGENNVYLHGLPDFIAPDTQTHVPFVSWISPEFVQRFGLDMGCIASKQDWAISHDNFFHSLLGLVAVNSAEYQRSKDIFGSCRQVGGVLGAGA